MLVNSGESLVIQLHYLFKAFILLDNMTKKHKINQTLSYFVQFCIAQVKIQTFQRHIFTRETVKPFCEVFRLRWICNPLSIDANGLKCINKTLPAQENVFLTNNTLWKLKNRPFFTFYKINFIPPTFSHHVGFVSVTHSD